MSWLRRALRRTTPLTRAVAAVAVLAAAGCGGSTNAGERVIHADGDGPLFAHSGSGSLSIDIPRGQQGGQRVWSGSFGAFTLCAQDPDADITLNGVRLGHGGQPPRRVQVFLRTVPPPGQRPAKAVAGARDPFLSTYGAPPRYEDGADDDFAGSYTTRLGGTRITQPCDPRPDPSTGYQELVFALTVGPQGGEVRRAWLDYTADGEPHTIKMTWRMIACGNAYPAHVC